MVHSGDSRAPRGMSQKHGCPRVQTMTQDSGIKLKVRAGVFPLKNSDTLGTASCSISLPGLGGDEEERDKCPDPTTVP